MSGKKPARPTPKDIDQAYEAIEAAARLLIDAMMFLRPPRPSIANGWLGTAKAARPLLRLASSRTSAESTKVHSIRRQEGTS